VLALLVIGARSRDVLSQPIQVASRLPLQNFPEQIADWTAVPSSSTLPALRGVGADEELVRTYRSPSGALVALYVGYYRSQQQGREIVGDATALVPEPVIDSVTLPLTANESIEVNRLADGREPLHALFWYHVDGAPISRGPQAKLQTIWSALTERRTNGAFVTVRWAAPDDREVSLQDMAAFVRPLLPVLGRYIS
jgi:EpsI family protein